MAQRYKLLQQITVSILITLVVLSAGKVIIYTSGLPQQPLVDKDYSLRANRNALRILLGSNSSGQLEAHIRDLSSLSSFAGSKSAMHHVEYVEKYWRTLGFQVARRSYEVPMSYFEQYNETKPSIEEESSSKEEVPNVSVCFEANSCKSLELDKPLTQEDRRIEGLSKAFYVFSRPLIGNFGLIRFEDLYSFKSGDNLTNLLDGNLVLIRPNETGSIEMIMRLAAKNSNNTGILLVFASPADEVDHVSGSKEGAQIRSRPYPEGPGLPNTAVTFHIGGPEDIVGDPTTPGHPSRWYASRREPGGKEGWKSVLNTTVIPISVADADALANAFFVPSYTEARPYLQINWPLKFGYRQVHDSCAELPGIREPDRVVLIGSHRDAWFGGAIDPHTGIATLLETSWALAELSRKTGWRPRRTILMCTWDAEEIGLMGSVEWVEEEYMRAGSRLVAYFNTDTDIMGDWKMMIQASDQLTDAINDVLLEAPDASDIDDTPRHFFYELDDSSDYFSFTRALGVPACDISYIRGPDKTLTLYDLYHTRYETSSLYRMLDSSGAAHVRLTQTVATLVYTISDVPLLPLNMSAFADVLRRRLYEKFFESSEDTSDEADTHERSDLNGVRQRLKEVAFSALKNATSALNHFESTKANLTSDDLHLRIINDKMMLVQKAFTHHCVFPCDGTSINLLNGLPSNIPAEKVAQTIILGLNSVVKLLSDSFVNENFN